MADHAPVPLNSTTIFDLAARFMTVKLLDAGTRRTSQSDRTARNFRTLA